MEHWFFIKMSLCMRTGHYIGCGAVVGILALALYHSCLVLMTAAIGQEETGPFSADTYHCQEGCFGLKNFTLADLEQYSGRNPSRPIYLSVKYAIEKPTAKCTYVRHDVCCVLCMDPSLPV